MTIRKLTELLSLWSCVMTLLWEKTQDVCGLYEADENCLFMCGYTVWEETARHFSSHQILFQLSPCMHVFFSLVSHSQNACPVMIKEQLTSPKFNHILSCVQHSCYSIDMYSAWGNMFTVSHCTVHCSFHKGFELCSLNATAEEPCDAEVSRLK